MRITYTQFSLCLICTACFYLSGCSYTYTDTDGVTHIIGLVKVDVKTNVNSNKIGANATQITTIGLSVTKTPANSAFTLGYNRAAIAVVHNDSCIKPVMFGEQFLLDQKRKNVSIREGQEFGD